jgi:HAD superfamily hydrolase (TIGR01484 family)
VALGKDTEKTNLKMLVLDLDGTILNDHKKIIPENLKAIQELKKKNPHIALCIATGRTFQTSIRFAKEIGADFLITDDGGAIYAKTYDHKYKLEKAFYMAEQECSVIYAQIIKYSRENPNLVWHFSTDNISHNSIIGYGKDSLKRAYQIFCPHEKITGDNVLQIKNFAELKRIGLNTHITKIHVYFGNKNIGRKQHQEFNKYLDKNKGKISYLSPYPTMKSIAPLDVDKGNAVIYVKEKLKKKGIYIKRSEIAIVGNDYNDLDMLKLEGYLSYCPANAIKQVKDLANVSPLKSTNNEPWLKELLEDFATQRQQFYQTQAGHDITSKTFLDKFLAKAKQNFPNHTPNTVSARQNTNKSETNKSSLDIAR